MNKNNLGEDFTYTHFLFTSEVMVSVDGAKVQTLLGSCVSLCLFDIKNKIGGINHYMVPYWNGNGIPSAKYGNIAIEILIEKMRQAGADLNYCQAKIFGGAHQLEFENDNFAVGERNIQVVEHFLSKNHISVAAKSVGGALGRKIVFDTALGVVLMKYIQKQPIAKDIPIKIQSGLYG